MHILRDRVEKIAAARPDCITDVSQLVPGKIVIGFSTYCDVGGFINQHHTGLAVVRGTPYRIVSEEIVQRGEFGKYINVEKLPAFTKSEERSFVANDSLLRISEMGIAGLGYVSTRLFDAGLLAVQEERFQVEQNLEVGPGLYVNGSNDYDIVFRAMFMAIAIDSDTRLAGRLPH